MARIRSSGADDLGNTRSSGLRSLSDWWRSAGSPESTVVTRRCVDGSSIYGRRRRPAAATVARPARGQRREFQAEPLVESEQVQLDFHQVDLLPLGTPNFMMGEPDLPGPSTRRNREHDNGTEVSREPEVNTRDE